MSRAVVFGASGMIGREIAARLAEGGETLAVSRGGDAAEIGSARAVAFDPLAPAPDWNALGSEPFGRVVFSQGVNRNDSLYAFDRPAFEAVMAANVTYVAAGLAELLSRGLLVKPARIVVIASIWGSVARQDKMSYIVSKAAVQGLVLSAATDLGRDGHLVNAVLPGALDTAMTRAMLAPEQIARIENSTLFGRLANVRDVVETVEFLCSDRNGSVTGQMIAVDVGFRHVHRL